MYTKVGHAISQVQHNTHTHTEPQLFSPCTTTGATQPEPAAGKKANEDMVSRLAFPNLSFSGPLEVLSPPFPGPQPDTYMIHTKLRWKTKHYTLESARATWKERVREPQPRDEAQPRP